MRRAALVVVLILAGGALVSADDPDPSAEALVKAREAEALAHTGDYLGAVPLFKQALALDPRAEYQCNIGVAYYKAQDLPRAQLFLSLCLARGSHLEAAFLQSVRNVLVTIEDTLRAGDFAPVEVSVSPAGAEILVSAFAEDEVVVGSRTLWLPFGEHRLTVSALGHVSKVEILNLTSRDRAPVTVRLDKQPEPDPVVPIDAGAVTEIDAGVVVAPAPGPERTIRTAAWLATGATVLIGAGTIGLYLRATGTAEKADGIPGGPEYDQLAAQARLQRSLAYVGYGVTAACLAVTAYLWWRSMPRERTQVGATASGDGATVWLTGSF